MEDILASIKRIIADDSYAVDEDASRVEQGVSDGDSSRIASGPLQLVEEMKEPQQPVSEEILELTQAVEPPESPARTPIDSQPETSHADQALRPAEAFVSRNITSTVSPIVSDDAASASRSSLAALSALLVKSESENGENTLEGLVREMLRPMMKDWLDQKLPELVERLVEKEIGRITGRLP